MPTRSTPKRCAVDHGVRHADAECQKEVGPFRPLWHLVGVKRIGSLLGLMLAALGMAPVRAVDPPLPHVEAVAKEAVARAVALPPGNDRDLVLRAVSRNLRWFGQPTAGVDAARAMSDHGFKEVAPDELPRPSRSIPLKEAMPSRDSCNAGIWRERDGGEARSPRAREKWAEDCLLQRDFDYIGLPDVEQVRTVAETLPPSATKGLVLAMLVRRYRDPTSLRLVERELATQRGALPTEAREGLTRLMAGPAVLYALGRHPEAVAAAQAATVSGPKYEIILMLLRDDAVADALAVFGSLERAPPPEIGGCLGFDPIGGLQFWSLGNAQSPSRTLGRFLDGLQSSTVFRRMCPSGLPAKEAVTSLLIAGRYDAAIARAQREPGTPFLLVDALFQSTTAMMRLQDGAKALAYARRAGAALPPFDLGDRPSPPSSTGELVMESMTSSLPSGPPRDFGERPGDTARRFEVIRVLAAAGAPDEAERLAWQQPAGAMRAVALSAAVAGRAGLRFDDQAPSIYSIEAGTVWGTTPR